MKTRADKTQENKSQSSANAVSQKRDGESAFQSFDNRPEAIAQRKLKEIANNSSQAMQLRTIQEMANNGSHIKQLAQLQAIADNYSAQQYPIQKKENKNGLPGKLKSGIENLSGYSMDDVKVHYNSDKPAQLQAHAYTQGTNIHLASGQEKHLPHEAWHVVQQKQGRVQPTMQLKGKVNINDNATLESEADVMGAKALQRTGSDQVATDLPVLQRREKSPFSFPALTDDQAPGKKEGNKCECMQLKSDPCYVPDWDVSTRPYWNLLAWEQQNWNIGPNLEFSEAQREKILQENRNIHKPGNSITINVKNSSDVQTSDGDNSALIRKRGVTFAIANVDHVVEKAKGGCASVGNAQVLAEDQNVGATYTGGKWIYDADNDKLYDPTPSNKKKYNLP